MRYRVADNGCWEWQGRTDFKGYGKVEINGVTMLAHRASYMLFVGAIPANKQLHHLCRNRLCINPEHLVAVTLVEHAGLSPNAQQDYCIHGHPLWGDNLRFRADTGTRVCKTCVREASQRRRERRKE